DGNGLAAGIHPQQAGTAFGGTNQIQQQANGGAFACAVWPQITEDFALVDAQVQMIECQLAGITFGEFGGFDYSRHTVYSITIFHEYTIVELYAAIPKLH